MTQANYLEVGKILNTHGVRGELKIQPWLDAPQLFQALPQLFVNGKSYTVQSVRMQGANVLVLLEGITSIDDALPLKGRVASAKREDMDEDVIFAGDLIGMEVFAGDMQVGTLTQVLDYPGNQVYVVKGEKEYMLPAVKEFILSTSLEDNRMEVKLLEGMETDAD